MEVRYRDGYNGLNLNGREYETKLPHGNELCWIGWAPCYGQPLTAQELALIQRTWKIEPKIHLKYLPRGATTRYSVQPQAPMPQDALDQDFQELPPAFFHSFFAPQ